MKLNKIFAFCGVMLLVACGERDVEKSDALKLVSEVKRIGLAPFVEKISPDRSIEPAYYVAVREINILSADLKRELAECFLIGDKSKPHGLSFAGLKGGTYYVSLDGTGVPEYFNNYHNREVIDNVYRIYR
jgi:hypothetical protein